MKKIYQGKRNPKCYFPNGYESPYELYEMSILDMWDPLIYGTARYSVKETPYYKYLEGDKKPMTDYLLETKGKTWARAAIGQEHLTVQDMFNMFEEIIQSDKDYLAPPYDSHYVIVRRDGLLIDGLRRSCVLLHNGIENIPVAVIQ